VRQFHSSFYAAKLVVEKVPALGESITEGTIASWSKSEGDRVAVDDVIVIVETDKVTVDIKSTHAGVLTKKIAVDNVS
jgi:2-oxoglutarate dehydrogenase E2 component (dihydrolipoamide succinyltransferase)